MKQRLLWCLAFLLFNGCQLTNRSTLESPASTQQHKAVAEQVPVFIPLADLQSGVEEFSGMAWYRDYLLLLPQYPNFGNATGDGRLFALAKSDILAFLAGKSNAPLHAKEIPFFTSGIINKIKGFQGFEAIAVDGERVYLSIEAKSDAMLGYLVAGTLQADLSELRLDAQVLIPIPVQAAVDNAAYEALIMNDKRLIALYEVNGHQVTQNPVAYTFALPSLTVLSQLKFPNIEYRITDATSTDGKGRFWGVNYFFPGDSKDFQIGKDEFVERYGQGGSHAKLTHVERLIEFQFDADAIKLTNTPPIQLQLANDGGRNWEGVVRLDDLGFLLVTDGFPKTLLAFVPKPQS